VIKVSLCYGLRARVCVCVCITVIYCGHAPTWIQLVFGVRTAILYCLHFTNNVVQIRMLDGQEGRFAANRCIGTWCLRRILDIRWHDFVRNDALCRMTKPFYFPPLSSPTDSLFGLVTLMSELADANQILFAQRPDNWRRPPGRPCSTWNRNICKDLSSSGMELPEASSEPTFLADVNEG